jgi:hypothetical protein
LSSSELIGRVIGGDMPALAGRVAAATVAVLAAAAILWFAAGAVPTAQDRADIWPNTAALADIWPNALTLTVEGSDRS